MAPRTSGPVSSSSPGPATDVVLLKTPTAQLAVNGGSQHPDKRRAGGHGPTLADEVEWLLPTPTAHDGKGSGPSQLKRNSLTLQEIAHLLPTPEASDASGGRVSAELGGTRPSGAKRSITLATAVHHKITLLPTPAASVPQDGESFETWEARRQVAAAKHGNNGIGTPLTIAVQLLATPRASDGEKGGPNQCNSRGGYDALPGQVHPDRFGKYAAAIERWEQITNTKAPDPTEPTGRNGGHRLSPAFAAWMMGLHKFHITDEGNGLSRKAQLKLIGNAVVPHQASHAVSGLLARAVEE